MAKQPPTLKFNHSLKIKEDCNEYTIQMKRKRNWWWLLLLLLPLLLLIRCKHDITVTAVDDAEGYPIEELTVNANYNSRFLFDEGEFFAKREHDRQEVTDSAGVAVFKDVECSVYSYLFFFLDKIAFTTEGDCYVLKDSPVESLLHFTRNVELRMIPKRADVTLHVVDKETLDDLAGAHVEAVYQIGASKDSVTGETDPSGEVTFKDVPECGLFRSIKASCYGYNDTTLIDKSIRQIMSNPDSALVKLTPKETSITFFVKNRLSKEPIPGARCEVILTYKGKVRSKGTGMTNVDGKGMGEYDNAFVLATVEIKATAKFYKPGKLKKDFTVEQFIKASEDDRTIWLDPEPQSVDFQLVDSLTREPIAGAKVTVSVTDGRGDKVSYPPVTSNRNGKFPVKACKGDRVHIHAEMNPMYHPKDHVVKRFDKSEVVEMSPVLIDLLFRTLKASDNSALPECDLKISTSHSRLSKPNKSSKNGDFTLQVYKGEILSITAAKKGYATNSTKVSNKNTSALEIAAQSERDIPLKADPVVYNYSGNTKGVSKECYDLKEAPCGFSFTWSTCSACTMLEVIDDNGNVLGRFGIDSPNGDSRGVIHSAPSGSTVLRSSTQNICVTMQNVNGCNCSYTITPLY